MLNLEVTKTTKMLSILYLQVRFADELRNAERQAALTMKMALHRVLKMISVK